MANFVSHTMVIEIPHMNIIGDVKPQETMVKRLAANLHETWAELYNKIGLAARPWHPQQRGCGFNLGSGWGLWMTADVISVDFFKGTDDPFPSLHRPLRTTHSSLLKIVTKMTQDTKDELNNFLSVMPYCWFPDCETRLADGEEEGVMMAFHWYPDIKHDEGLDADGVRIFVDGGSSGTLELASEYEPIDYFQWNVRCPTCPRPRQNGDAAVWLAAHAALAREKLPGCRICCNPHAVASISFTKPTKSANKKVSRLLAEHNLKQ